MSDHTQLTPASGYDVSRMTFSKPQEGSIPNNPAPTYRIYLGTVNEDGTTGDLIIPTERCFSFGLGENTNDKGEVTGYSLPICLYTRNMDGKAEPTKAEKDFVETFNNIVEHCKDYLLKDEINI